jgi:hypothetical protein
MIVMDFIMVEPVKNKLSAYHFDGSKESAEQALDKWDCIIGKNENFDNKYVITFSSSKQCYPNGYIVIENQEPIPYTQDEFIKKYQVAYSIRDRIGSFYSID